jgi:hypothetical protein
VINFKSPEPVFRETGIFLRVPVFIDTCSGLFEITTHENACGCLLASIEIALCRLSRRAAQEQLVLLKVAARCLINSQAATSVDALS